MIPTLGQAVRVLAARLAAVGIDSARLDARLLAAQALGIEPSRVLTHPETALTAEEAVRLDDLAARRLDREPMSHILGHRGFWTLDLKVTRDTLDPRPDTETVVETVLDLCSDRQRPWRILDFGTGSGCILLALLSEYGNARGTGIDLSAAALAVAGENAVRTGLAARVVFSCGDWGRGLDGPFDIVVSNPPYIPDNDIDALEPEVACHEPRSALAGGKDGLECYRALAPEVSRLLVRGGLCVMEVGAGQDGEVASLLAEAGLRPLPARRDLAGIARCVVATKP